MHACQVSKITNRRIHTLYREYIYSKLLGDANTSTRPRFRHFYAIHKEWIQNKNSLCKNGRLQGPKGNLFRTELCKMKLMLGFNRRNIRLSIGEITGPCSIRSTMSKWDSTKPDILDCVAGNKI